MKITDVEYTPLLNGRVIIQVRTDKDITGYAELPRHSDSFEGYLESTIKPLLVGQDPLQINRHWETLYLGYGDRVTKVPPHTVGAIDTALWDILGKETGLPCYTLMGGAARLEIPLYWSVGWGWQKTPDQMLDDVMDGWDQGYKAFKIRMDWKIIQAGLQPRQTISQMFKLVRDFLPNNIYLGFDANNGYSVPTAIQHRSRLRRTMDASTTSRSRSLSTTSPDSGKSPTHSTSQSPPASRTGIVGASETSSRLGNPDILQPDILRCFRPVRNPENLHPSNHPQQTHNAALPRALASTPSSSIHCYSSIKNAIRPHEFSIEFAPPLERNRRTLWRTRNPPQRHHHPNRQTRPRHRHERSRPSQTIRLTNSPGSKQRERVAVCP